MPRLGSCVSTSSIVPWPYTSRNNLNRIQLSTLAHAAAIGQKWTYHVEGFRADFFCRQDSNRPTKKPDSRQKTVIYPSLLMSYSLK